MPIDLKDKIVNNIPIDLVNYIYEMTVPAVIEKEVELIRSRILPDHKYYLTRAGVFRVTSEFRTNPNLPPTGFVERNEPVWRFRMNDSDPTLPIFNEYVRQLSPYLARPSVAL